MPRRLIVGPRADNRLAPAWRLRFDFHEAGNRVHGDPPDLPIVNRLQSILLRHRVRGWVLVPAAARCVRRSHFRRVSAPGTWIDFGEAMEEAEALRVLRHYS